LYKKLERTNSEGYPPDRAAYDYIGAIVHKKEEAFVGGPEGILLFIGRLYPRTLNRIIGKHPIRRIRKLKEKLHLGKPAVTG
jgi:hypothetical protein